MLVLTKFCSSNAIKIIKDNSINFKITIALALGKCTGKFVVLLKFARNIFPIVVQQFF